MNNKLLAIVTISFVLLVSFFVLFSRTGERHNWRVTYEPSSEEPYGTYFIKSLLSSLYEDHDFEELDQPLRTLLDDKEGAINYVFIGERLYLDDESRERLISHVHDGSRAFIASNYLPEKLVQYIADTSRSYQDVFPKDYDLMDVLGGGFTEDTVANMMINNSDSLAEPVSFYYRGRTGKEAHRWYFINQAHDKDRVLKEITGLGFISGHHTNFFKIKVGEGAFYFHMSPLVFTNYHINRDEGFQYAREAFTNLEPGPVYFDEFHDRKHYSKQETQTPFAFILSKPALRVAWYLLLLTMLLFLLFKAKRRQRIIPVLPTYANDTMNFIQTIGRLHQKQQNVKGIVEKQMNIFLSFLREHYYLATNVDEAELIRKVAEKSEISEQLVRNIFVKYKDIQRSGHNKISEEELRIFYSMLQNFYKKCK